VSPTLAAWLAAAESTDAEFVESVWRPVLRREPEPAARDRVIAKLADGSLARSRVLPELVTDGEFERVLLFDDAPAFAAGARLAGERPCNLPGPAGCDERVIEIPVDGWRSTSSFELRPRRLSELVRLGVRDLPRRGEPRRSTRGH
jgi:hypothetical protein